MAENQSEAAKNADFSGIRYAQCWEDADILLEGLSIKPGDVCLSIASAGDNALAMVSQRPSKVFAIDLSPAQLACLALRVAAYRALNHGELLELMGARSSKRRDELYIRCRKQLSNEERAFWDAHPAWIEQGIGHIGKFENYFRLFREKILPLIHDEKTVYRLIQGGTFHERHTFYQKKWNNWRWRLMFYIFFSRFVMGRFGRDPAFFKYVEGRVSKKILSRTQYAFTELNPIENPYLQWIMLGKYHMALPFSLREESFDLIRHNLDCLEWQCVSLEDFLDSVGEHAIDRFNLSDIFEYMSEENYIQLLGRLIKAGCPDGRLAYWNMLVPRHCPDSFRFQLKPLDELSEALFLKDKAFFYSRFVVEEIQ